MNLTNLEIKVIELSDDLYSSKPDYISGYIQCQMDVIKLLRKELGYGETRSTDTNQGVSCE